MHEADPSLLKFLELAGPWLGSAGGTISAVVAWIVNRMQKQIDKAEADVAAIVKGMPETYARRDDVNARLDRLEDRITASSAETNRKLDMLVEHAMQNGQK
jgi:septal ring factor EnvC (AmiA/AmiB activator)